MSRLRIDTGRDSQALITGATVQAMLDPAYSLRWKTPAGFVDLTAEQIIGVATAARAHVQAAFNREAELLEALEVGSLCAHGGGMPAPLRSLIEHFPDELDLA